MKNFLKRLFQKKEESPVIGRLRAKATRGRYDFLCWDCYRKRKNHDSTTKFTLEDLKETGKEWVCLWCYKKVDYLTEKEKHELS